MTFDLGGNPTTEAESSWPTSAVVFVAAVCFLVGIVVNHYMPLLHEQEKERACVTSDNTPAQCACWMKGECAIDYGATPEKQQEELNDD